MSSDAVDFDYPASGRFGTALASASLVVSQELANTIGMDHVPVVDLLGQVDTAQHWIDAVVPHWCALSGAQGPHLVITAAELPRLRAVRDALRSVVGEHADPRSDAVIAGTAAVKCRVALYDRSKNNSRIWHDTATCGNQTNARAHRARRRLQSG